MDLSYHVIYKIVTWIINNKYYNLSKSCLINMSKTNFCSYLQNNKIKY